ncbi:MAG: diaminopimelate epimerase [bacterium]
MRLEFTKMHGLGNHFVVVDGLVPGTPSVTEVEPHIAFMGDGRFGIGFDQFLFVLPSEKADFYMGIYNTDGWVAEMCGNGIRAFAKFVYERRYTDKREITVDTLGGLKTLELTVVDGKVTLVKVDMGKPGLDRADLPMTGVAGVVQNESLEVGNENVLITGVSMGNPHAVFFADTATDDIIDRVGPKIEHHSRFPRRINVHEVEVLSPTEIKMLTWERGAGRTLACGTGACASVVASALNGKTGRRVLVHLAGGDLQIEWADDDHVYMTGPATEVFTGVIELAD